MARVNSVVSRHIAKAPGLLRPVVTEEGAGNFGSMVLDSSGLVFKCSDSAARMLGGRVADVEGSPIWSLIADLMPSDTSPSFNARFLAHLSSTGCWREFQAIDIAGAMLSSSTGDVETQWRRCRPLSDSPAKTLNTALNFVTLFFTQSFQLLDRAQP
jgi:hypothetical protein